MRNTLTSLCALALVGIAPSCTSSRDAVDSGTPGENDGGIVVADSGTDIDSGIDAGNFDGGGDSNDGGWGNCSLSQLESIEQKIGHAIDLASTDASVNSVSDYTLILERSDGRVLTHTHGSSSIDSIYESASSSKWISAAIILDLVDQGKLTLDSTAHDFLPEFWTETSVTLRDLLSFRSGLNNGSVECVSDAGADFRECVENIYTTLAPTASAVGSQFSDSTTDLQVAGLMAVRASGLASWTEVFTAFKAKTGLFSSSTYDIPSASNPRLGGGMHWSAKEYHAFLKALVRGDILSSEMRSQMFANQRGAASVQNSPINDKLNEDWAFGFGNWLECASAKGVGSFNCGEGHRNSNPGSFGAYAFIDFDESYFGILARQGSAGTIHEGVNQFRAVEPLVQQWAKNECPGVPTAGFLSVIRNDMGLNEMPLLNVTKTEGWAKKAVIDMGNAPRGDATPSYWTPAKTSYKSSEPWLAITPWWVIFPGVDHAAVNTRVEVYDAKIYFLKKSTKTWVTVSLDGIGQWAKYMDFALNSDASLGSALARSEPGGGKSYTLGSRYEPIHGGYSGFSMSDYNVQPNDIAAVVMQLKTRLVLNNSAGVDDRAKAKILVQVGADYYPTVGTSVMNYTPMTYAPAAASSRFGLVGNVERIHFFATIDPPGNNNTGSEYVAAGHSVTIPVAELGANMPPIR